jgi:hypothetical protein
MMVNPQSRDEGRLVAAENRGLVSYGEREIC